MYACEKGNLETVKLLLNNGLNVNATDLSGNNTLIYSALSNNSEIIQLIINSGLTVNKVNKNNETALITAVKNKKLFSVKSLMKNNSDETIKDIYDRTALDWAVKKKYLTFSEIIIKLSKNDIYKNDLLFWAIENDYIYLVDQLLENSVNINVYNKKNQTPLYKAVVYKKFNIAYNLLRKGANPNLPPKAKTTVLMNAIKLITGKVIIDPYDDNLRDMYNSLDDFNKINHTNKEIEINIVDSLIEYGASVNPDSSIGSPLTVAVETGNILLAKELVRRGAELNITDDKGNNLLQILLEKNKDNPNLFELFRYFENKGADIKWTNSSGVNVFMAAVESNSIETVKYLLKKIPDLNINQLGRHNRCALTFAIRNKNYELVQLLINNNIDLNISIKFKQWYDYINDSILRSAILQSDSISVLLLENGIDILEKYYNNETPLMLASQCKRVNTIRKLLELGADPNQKDNSGKSSFDHARKNKEVLDVLYRYKK